MNPLELRNQRDRPMKKKTQYKLSLGLKTLVPAHNKYLREYNPLRS